MTYTPEEALEFTRRSVALLVAWPPPVDTPKRKLFLLDVYLSICFVSCLISFVTLVYAIYAHRDDLEIIIHATCYAVAMIQLCVKMTACRMQRTDLQSIVEEIKFVLDETLPYERAILEKYVNRCALLHLTLTFGFYFTGTSLIMGPIFLSQPFPSYAEFPFDVDPHPIYEIVYIQQAFSILLACTAATIDCQVATLLWFAGARFEMLKTEIENIVDEYTFRRCVLKHHRVIRYAENVAQTVRFVILATVGIMTMLITFSGLLFLSTDSLTIKFQFLVLDVVAILQLFLTSYPAENLLEMSYSIGTTAYNINWIDKSPQMWRNVCILIHRSQKPIKVSVGGLLPSLSLTYYMSFLSSSFSYFTTMRAVVQ